MIYLSIRYRTGNKNIKAIDKAIDKNKKVQNYGLYI